MPFPLPGGAVGSNVDQPSVWQRAQFSSNNSWPSLTLARRFFHSSDHADRGLVGRHRRGGREIAAARDRLVERGSRERRRRRVGLLLDLGALRRERRRRSRPWRSSAFCAALRFVARSTFAAASVFCASASSSPGHVMYSGHVYFDGSSERAAASAVGLLLLRLPPGVIWIDSMYETRSAIDWSFFGPPPTTPHGCIGVPGRP